jgi:hypothetical protein
VTQIRVEHRVAGTIGRVILNHSRTCVVQWDNIQDPTCEEWKHLIRVEDRQLPESGVVVQGIEFPPGMPRDSEMGCYE